MLRRALSAVALLTASLSPGCSSSSSCTDVACASGAHFQSGVHLNGTNDQLTIDICKNNACAHGTAEARSATTGQPTCGVVGSIDAACSLTLGANGNATFAVDVPGPGASVNVDDLADGDIYRVRVTRAQTNESLVDVTKPVTYTKTQPNGPSCPPTCKHADFS